MTAPRKYPNDYLGAGNSAPPWVKEQNKILREQARLRGDKKYQRLNPCSRGHTSPTRVSTNSCIECENLWANKRNLIWNHRRRKYGLTKDQFDEIWSVQEGRCAICQKSMKCKNSANVDHCHRTGDIRGILCRSCNVGLGLFKDNTSILTMALRYLGVDLYE